MSADLLILVPVLGRPHRVAPLLDSIEATVPKARVLFLGDLHDTEETREIGRQFDARVSDDGLRINHNLEGGSYALKVNRGVSHPKLNESLIFLGADDLDFKPGWFEAAKAAMQDGVEVVGVNDLIDRTREHATHFLITREYGERPCIDGSPGPLYGGYAHWWVDDELIATANRRGVYAYAPDAHVRHLHPIADRAEDDDTYRKGRARMHQDRRLFKRRQRLWA